jgi:Leucine-rich repeat (LRR) protein
LQNLNVVDIGAIQAYPHLQQLFLDRNSLRSLSALEPLIHLTEVTATDNKLVGAFPDFVGARALERIDVSGNRFTSFSTNLEKHSYLTHLTISRTSGISLRCV